MVMITVKEEGVSKNYEPLPSFLIYYYNPQTSFWSIDYE